MRSTVDGPKRMRTLEMEHSDATNVRDIKEEISETASNCTEKVIGFTHAHTHEHTENHQRTGLNW